MVYGAYTLSVCTAVIWKCQILWHFKYLKISENPLKCLETLRHHKYLWSNSVESLKSRITMSKLMTTCYIHKICNDGKSEDGPCLYLYLYGESLLLIKKRRNSALLPSIFIPKQFLKKCLRCYMVEIQVINNEILIFWGSYPHRKELYTPLPPYCVMTLFNFLQSLYFHHVN